MDLRGELGEPKQGTVEIKQLLERRIQRDPNHPGLNHLYIHLMEMSPNFDAAMEMANRIPELAPDAGHLVHMATHIYMPLGMFKETIELNHRAIECDRKYMAHETAYVFYPFFMAHNWHFIVYAAMMNGQYALARNAAKQVREVIPPSVNQLHEPQLFELGDGFSTMLYHVMMRFGKWDEILSLPFPSPSNHCVFAVATLHFTRAIAHAALGNINEALAEEQVFLRAWDDIPPSRMFLFNNCRRILSVGTEMLRGEITYRQRNYRQAFEHLRKAVQLEDSLQYDEPWAWMQPVRHALGAFLLEQNRLTEAEEAFRQDLSKPGTGAYRGNPNNIWSLVGMQQCLERQGRKEEAQQLDHRLKVVREVADTPVRASCFCARNLIHESS